MNARVIIGLAGMALLIAVSPASGQQKPEDLLQSGRYAEEVEGDLRGAISIFQRIITDFPSHRTVVAEALVRLGRAFETLGEAGAQRAYERVLSSYPDQAEAAAEARSRLASLQAADEADRKPGITERQVWAEAPASGLLGISRDGRYMAFRDDGRNRRDPDLPGRGDLAVYDTQTGRSRLLTNRAPDEKWALDITRNVAWSADGARLAYSRWNEEGRQEIQVLRLDGSEDRILPSGGEGINPVGWSPDGDFIVSELGWRLGDKSIGTVSVEDGSVQVIKTMGPHDPRVSLSPDGRYVTYDYPQTDDKPHRDVFILATDGSSEERLVSHPANDRRPFWTPDGERVVFQSDRSGQTGLYALEVRDGRPVGSAELVRPDVGGGRIFGFSRSGALYYEIFNPRLALHVAEGDLFDKAGTLGEPSPLTERFVGTNMAPVWSPDGRSIAYISRRGPGRGFAVVKALDTGVEQDFAVPILSRPAWSADGRHLMIGGYNGSRISSYRLDLETGDVTPEPFFRDIVGQDSYGFTLASSVQEDALRAAGIRILLGRAKDLEQSTQRGLTLRPDEELMWMFSGMQRQRPGGDVEEIGPPQGDHRFALSPDGTQMAWAANESHLSTPDRLLVMPIEGGEIRELTRLATPSAVAPLRAGKIDAILWTPDGKRLLYQVGRDADREPEVWQIAVEGGVPERLDVELDLNGASLHPDGNRIALSTRIVGAEIWLMEGFPWQN